MEEKGLIEHNLRLSDIFDEHAEVFEKTRKVCGTDIKKTVYAIIECFRNSGKVMACGNGGSAADCQHFAAELVGRFQRERKGLPAISLTTDTSVLTSVANDYEYSSVFSRQIEAFASYNDVLVAFSCSGDSMNVINALMKAKELGCNTIGLTGSSGGKMAGICDICIKVPSSSVARIQEMHDLIIHMVCDEVERYVCRRE